MDAELLLTSPVEPALRDLGGWPAVLGRLVRREDLSFSEAAAAMGEVLAGAATPAQIAAFITALRVKGETVEEMAGLVHAMLRAAEPLRLEVDLVDTCGSGGGAIRRTAAFNVSTIASLVIAGAGVTVCKHGNRAASSTSGSADVLEALGVVIDLGPQGVAHCVERAGMAFCFARRFHPAMRHAGPTRAELGVPTVFNFLGPLANPARPRRQVLGVSDPAMAEKMLAVLQRNGARRVLVVHGHDGLDELTLTDASTVLELDGPETRRYVFDPVTLGLPRVPVDAVRGGDPATNAALARRILDGVRGPHRDLVLLNAAAGLVAAGRASDLADGLGQAERAVDDGRAAAVLERLVAASREAAG